MTAQHDPQPNLARRAFAASLGLLPAMPMLASLPASAQTLPTPASESGVFRHAGMILTDADISRIRAHIAAGEQPWTYWWNRLCGDRITSLDSWPSALEAVYRLDNSKNALYRDIYRTWCMSLRWRLSDDTRYADKVVQTLDAWSSKLKLIATKPPGSTLNDDHTFILMAGMQGHQFAQVGELMRGYPGWSAEGQERFKEMLLNVFARISSDWLTGEMRWGNGMLSHANWHLASMVGVMAIGVFCDRHDLYQLACDYYAANNRGELKMFGNGSIVHGVYYMHPGHMGQWQESGRDQGHSTLGMSLGGDLLEMAWNQGDDLYGLYNNRFLAAAEYVARSNLKDENGNTYTLPFARQHNAPEPHTSLWTQVNQSFQHYRGAWEPIYNHYVNRMGLAAPNVTRMAMLCEPNHFGGNGDDIVYPTLVHRRPAYAGPMQAPSGLIAPVRGGRPVLSWWGSVGATSYEVKRSARAGGPFAYLATVQASDLLTFTDSPPNGIWFYQVTALGAGNAGASSAVVRAAVPGERRLSMPLNGMNGTDTIGALLTPEGRWTAVQGTLVNGATWGEGRQGDKAIVFDGQSAGLQLPPGILEDLDDFTVSMWAYANSLHWDSCLFFAGNDTLSYMRIAPMPARARGLRFGICAAGFNDEQSVDAPYFMPIRRWVHVAFTLQGGTGRLYMDGAEVASSDRFLLSPRQVGDQVAFLGRNWGHPAFNGRIQGFRVEAGALSAEAVAALAK